MASLATGGEEPTGVFTHNGQLVSVDSGASWSFAAQSSIYEIDAEARAIPTLDSWGLVLFALVIAAFAAAKLRRA